MSEPVIAQLQARPFAYVSLSSSLTGMPQAVADGFERLSRMFDQADVTVAGTPMAHYLGFDNRTVSFDLGYPALPADVERLKAAGLSLGETPGGAHMVALHVGPYDTVTSTYRMMDTAMRTQHVTGARDMWECYPSPPQTPPNQVQTEVIWPLLPSEGEFE